MVRPHLEALSKSFDNDYLRLNEMPAHITPEALGFFRKARAMSALVFALSPDTELLHEALYEAVSACDDREAAVRSIEMELCSDMSGSD